MPESVVLPIFVALFALAVVWLALILWTFNRLSRRHPATYEAIGSPSLFWNNTFRNNWLFAKFLLQGQWRGLGDSALAAVARVMQVLLVVYFVAFIGLLIVFFTVGVKP